MDIQIRFTSKSGQGERERLRWSQTPGSGALVLLQPEYHHHRREEGKGEKGRRDEERLRAFQNQIRERRLYPP